MTEKDHSRFSPGDSGKDTQSRPDMKRGEEQDFEISGLKTGLEARLRDLDSLRPAQAPKQTISDGVDTAIDKSTDNESRDSFELLLREGSKSSKAKNASQSNGCIPLMLIFSFIISLAFPIFWIIFVLILLGVLASSGREWIG